MEMSNKAKKIGFQIVSKVENLPARNCEITITNAAHANVTPTKETIQILTNIQTAQKQL